MNDDFMKRLAPHIAPFFPVIEGESKDDYVQRYIAANVSPAVSAAVISIARRIESEIARDRQQRKDRWIASARRAFRPSRAAPCQVCGKYKALAHAHHLVPLSLQYERGFRFPDNDHVWLCPTHHAALHALIGRDDRESTEESLRARGRRGLDGVVDMELEELDVLLQLLSMAGWGMA